MEKSKFCKRFMLWTAIVTAVVMLILGLCFGKVIEENLTQEILKWVFGTLGIICIFEVFAFSVSQICYHWMDDYKKLYGDKWFAEGLKDDWRSFRAGFSWKKFFKVLGCFVAFFIACLLVFGVLEYLVP